MFLRFENDLLVEASAVKYRTDRYRWFDAPSDFSEKADYLLVDGQLTKADAQQAAEIKLGKQKSRYLEKALRLIDQKRFGEDRYLPGKEREYRMKQYIVKDYSGDINVDNMPLLVLLSEEAQQRGITIDELALLIKGKIKASHERLAALAAVEVAAKKAIANVAGFTELQQAFGQVLADIAAFDESPMVQ